MTTTKNIAFWFLFTMILSISALDLYLIIRFQNVLIHEEKNIVGIWLIRLDSGSVALFSAVKMFGTCLSLMIWKKILISNHKYGFTIGIGILLFQIFLFCWLLFF